MLFLRIGLIVSLFLITGCDDKAAEASPPTATADEAPQPAADPKAEVGTKHDPPIALDKVPDGAWYCDMGTAHYTQAAEGDGKCPLCGMALKKMARAEKPGDGEAHDHQH